MFGILVNLALWFVKITMIQNMPLAFSSHNCDAAFSPFSADFCFTNHRLSWEGWFRVSRRIVTALCWFWRSSNALIDFLQSYVSLGTTWFNEGKWIGNGRSQLCGCPYKRFPTYTWKKKSEFAFMSTTFVKKLWIPSKRNLLLEIGNQKR